MHARRRVGVELRVGRLGPLVSVRPGIAWGEEWLDAPDCEVDGSDADLREAVVGRPGLVVRFRPTGDSDLARSIGLPTAVPSGSPAGAPIGIAVPMDLLELSDGRCALNIAILGTPPARQRSWTRNVDLGASHGIATGAVVATGQFLDGLDIVPKGHPGDGRAELCIYRLARRQRSSMRQRLTSGTHVPHPGIETTSVRSVTFEPPRPVPIVIDGADGGRVGTIRLQVVPGAYRLLL